MVSEGLQPQAWEKLLSYNIQSWSQLDEENDELSCFEREKLEKSQQQQREQQRIQNRESNQQHQTGRRISNNSRKSLGYSQQREGENEKDGSIAANELSSGNEDGVIEKENNNTIQELSEMFGGADGDGGDERDGELDAASVCSATKTVPRRSGRLRRAPDRYSPRKLGGLAALIYMVIRN